MHAIASENQQYSLTTKTKNTTKDVARHRNPAAKVYSRFVNTKVARKVSRRSQSESPKFTYLDKRGLVISFRDDGLNATDDGLNATDDGLNATDDGLNATDDGLNAIDACVQIRFQIIKKVQEDKVGC
jgi:hypothetical protein